jgi:N,N'-diacetyllegionaminate synthase
MENQRSDSRKAAASGSFSIGSRRIGSGCSVFIIAEVGVNHHGDVGLCAQMIEAAALAGADAVKLQTVDAEESYVAGTASHAEFRDKSLTDSAMQEMMKLAERLGVILFSTPGDFASLERMARLGMPAIKVSSGLMTNQPLIAEAARLGLPMIISTGLAYEDEIALAVDAALGNGAAGVAVLKCTALYPAPDDTINLLGMPSLGSRFGVPVGYSDHTLDDLACVAAVAMGATVIEKHFTLDKSRAGADHHISLEPDEFAQMVGKIRRLEIMRGHGRIEPVAAEAAVRAQRHRCLTARRDIAAGEVFSEANVALKRPSPGASGLSPAYYNIVLGKIARTAVRCDQPIAAEAVTDLP